MSNEAMSNTDKTKTIVKYLGILATNGFIVSTVDFSTGEILVSIPELEEALKKVDPNAEHPVYKLVRSEMDIAIRGDKIEAIKALRTRTSAGLADAKTIVEAFCADYASGKVKL